MAAVTEFGRRKAVGGILEKLRKEGMPASPVPGPAEEMDTALAGEEESDQNDQEIGATPRKKKGKNLAAVPAQTFPVPRIPY